MSDTNRTLAVFDYDNTLIEGDSMWPFLTAVAGLPAALAALAAATAHAALSDKAEAADFRTILKLQLIERLLTGCTLASLAPAIERLRLWQKWNEPVREPLLDHHAKGHRIVIMSGALDLYLPEIARGLPYDTLIATKVGVENGVVTGGLPDGNCVRARKAEKLADYIRDNGPFDDSWGYGNYPHDLPMLELVKHRVVV
jgi:HAD superfamily hydrolase (TIGR01490 family)